MPNGVINAVYLEGNVVSDAKMAMVRDLPICEFRIASGGRSSGTPTTFADCAALGRYGQAMAQHLRRGVHVVVFGTLRSSGGNRLSIRASRIVMAQGGQDAGVTMEDVADALFEDADDWYE